MPEEADGRSAAGSWEEWCASVGAAAGAAGRHSGTTAPAAAWRGETLPAAAQARNAAPQAACREQPADDLPQRPHRAVPHPDRARQFMPFAALRGYHELVQEEERAARARHADRGTAEPGFSLY